MAFADDVPPLWVSENADLVHSPTIGGRSALLTLDGDVIINDPDSDVESRSATPDVIMGPTFDAPCGDSSVCNLHE
jgi:hypothetical protein